MLSSPRPPTAMSPCDKHLPHIEIAPFVQELGSPHAPDGQVVKSPCQLGTRPFSGAFNICFCAVSSRHPSPRDESLQCEALHPERTALQAGRNIQPCGLAGPSCTRTIVHERISAPPT